MKLILSFFLFITTMGSIFGQIPNGDFEEWEPSSNGGEVPMLWNVFQNVPAAVFKSSDSHSGDYSLGLATLNMLDGTLSPARVGIKIKPELHDNLFSFHYKIDSISGNGKIRIQIIKITDQGAFDVIQNVTFNEVNNDFKKEEVSFSLPNLDTIIISLVSENQLASVGFTGFTRVLFDFVELNPITSTSNSLGGIKPILFPNPAHHGFFELANLQAKHKQYKILTLSGKIVQEGTISNQGFYLEEKGVYVIKIYDNNHQLLETLKLVNL